MRTANNKVTVEERRAATTKIAGQWLVRKGSRVIGTLEYTKPSNSEAHPWKAFVGIGMNARLAGYFWEADGGKQAAIDAIVAGS